MKVHHHAVSEEVVNPPPESDRIYVLLSVDLHAPRLPRHLLDGVDDPPPPGGPQRMSSDVREDLGGSLFGETEDTTRPRTRLAVERSVGKVSLVVRSIPFTPHCLPSNWGRRSLKSVPLVLVPEALLFPASPCVSRDWGLGSFWITTYTCTELVNLLQWYDLPTMFSLEFCLGFLGNLLDILGYIFCLKEWKSTEMYLFSILFMVWVSVDRCLLLQNLKRQHFLLRRGSAIAVSAFTWLVINVQIAPPLVILIFQDMKRGNRSRCGDFGSLSTDQAHDRLTYSLVVTGGLFRKRLAPAGASSYRQPLYVVAVTASMFPVLYSPCHAMRNIYISLHVSSNEGTPTPIICTELVNLLQWYNLATMYSLEFCLGFLGDLPVILGYIFCLKEWKSTDIYLFNLAVSDLLFQVPPRLEKCLHHHTPNRLRSHSVVNPAFYFLLGDQFTELLLGRVPPRLEKCLHHHTPNRLRSHSVVNPAFYFLLGDQFTELLLGR
ncbi:hypothetical protein JZ751_028766, partial [Albula glossodonta]